MSKSDHKHDYKIEIERCPYTIYLGKIPGYHIRKTCNICGKTKRDFKILKDEELEKLINGQ